MDEKNIKFEEAMQKLEDAVLRLESSNLTLEESILEFESAVQLIKLCENKLSEAKRRVRILTEGEDGTVTDEPFIQVNIDET